MLPISRRLLVLRPASSRILPTCFPSPNRILLSQQLQSQRWRSSSSPNGKERSRFQSETEHESENPFDFRSWDLKTKVVVGATVLGVGYYVVQWVNPTLAMNSNVTSGNSLERVPETGRWRFMDTGRSFEARVSLFVTNLIANNKIYIDLSRWQKKSASKF